MRSIHGLPVGFPVTTIRAADCRPRMSPPAACAASSAASIRSARSPFAVRSLGHRRPDLVVLHQVRLHREVGADDVAGGGDVLVAGVRRDLPCASIIATCRTSRPVSSASSALSASGRARAGAHQLQAELAVGRIDERLRRDRADAGLGPRHDRTDAEPVRLHRHAHVPSPDRARRSSRCGPDGPVGIALSGPSRPPT